MHRDGHCLFGQDSTDPYLTAQIGRKFLLLNGCELHTLLRLTVHFPIVAIMLTPALPLREEDNYWRGVFGCTLWSAQQYEERHGADASGMKNDHYHHGWLEQM